jgi:hypothetical protein
VSIRFARFLEPAREAAHSAAQRLELGSQISVPQQSELSLHGCIAATQRQTLAVGSHVSGPQQSDEVMHAAPLPPHAQVPDESQDSPPQHAAALAQCWPSVAQTHSPPVQRPVQHAPAALHAAPSSAHAGAGVPAALSAQVMSTSSHVSDPQQSASLVHTAPAPAQAGMHTPKAQSLEQHDPLEVQGVPSSAHSGGASPESAPPSPTSPPSLPVPPSLPASGGPASTDIALVPAHLPKLHAFEQQSEKAPQEEPPGRHAAEPPSETAPHVPEAQDWEQHWLALVHEAPSGLQWDIGGVHAPFGHAPLQQSVAPWHVAPFGRHCDDGAHALSMQLALQQSVGMAQLAPWAPQAGAAHAPVGPHVPLQQSDELWQALPAGEHDGGSHVPVTSHEKLQQSLGPKQLCPCGAQSVPTQSPSAHAPEQQSR